MTASLDRFEGNVAVFEDRDSGDSIVIPRDMLPDEARPGDLARLESGATPRFLELLPEETRALKDKLAAQRDRLRARRGD